MGKKCESVILPLSSLRFAAKLRLCVEVLYFVLRQSRIGNNRVPSHAYLLSIGCNRLSLVSTHVMQPPAFAWTLRRICDFCSVLSDVYTVSQKLLKSVYFWQSYSKNKKVDAFGTQGISLAHTRKKQQCTMGKTKPLILFNKFYDKDGYCYEIKWTVNNRQYMKILKRGEIFFDFGW